jgi:Cys-rich four helix bundle protein (predicted Tat secretion target)
MTTGVHRRDMIIGAMAGGAIVATSPANAQHQAHVKPNTARQTRISAYRRLATLAHNCVSTGENCLSHCTTLFLQGETSLAECADIVQQMIHVCRSVHGLAVNGSPFVGQMSEACVAVNEACRNTCLTHRFHDECLACATACEQMIESYRQLNMPQRNSG